MDYDEAVEVDDPVREQQEAEQEAERLRGQVKRTREAIDATWQGVGELTITLDADAAKKFQAYAHENGVELFQRRKRPRSKRSMGSVFVRCRWDEAQECMVVYDYGARTAPWWFCVRASLADKRRGRMRKKRHERRMLSLGRRDLRQQGERTQGGHRRTVSEQFLAEWEDRAWSMARHEVIGRGEQWRDRAAYWSKCGQCGERQPVQPCANPCVDEMPF